MKCKNNCIQDAWYTCQTCGEEICCNCLDTCSECGFDYCDDCDKTCGCEEND